MTELEIMQRAKMYLDKLARGIDPITDREVPDDSVLNNVRICRCLHYVSGVLERVIANGGTVGKREGAAFAITPEQKNRIQLSGTPVRLTELLNAIHNAAGDMNMKKPSAKVYSDWLVQRAFLFVEQGPDGKPRRMPTEQGNRAGIFSQCHQSTYGDYMAVYYDINAQRMILDHLEEISTGLRNDGGDAHGNG